MRSEYDKALLAYSATLPQCRTYTRSFYPNEWQIQKTDLDGKLKELWTILGQLDKAGNVSTPFFIDAATLYANIAFENLILTGLISDQAPMQSSLDIYRSNFVNLSKSLAERVKWANGAKDKIQAKSGPITWYYRSSKAKYRGYYHVRICSPTGEMLTELPTEYATELVYLHQKAGYKPSINQNDFANDINKCKQDFVDYTHLAASGDLDRILNRLAKLGCGTYTSENMSIFASRVPNQSYAPTITAPNGFYGHAVFGPYMHFGFDIVTPVFYSKFVSKDATYSSNGPRLLAMDQDAWTGTTWQGTLLTEKKLNDFAAVSTGAEFCIFGTNSTTTAKNANQEFRIWLDGAYPGTSLEFHKFRLLGFIDNAQPLPAAAVRPGNG